MINDVALVEAANRAKDTVVLADRAHVTDLHFNDKGMMGTLYTTTDNSKGFSVDPDVKVVLIVADEEKSSNSKIGKNLFDDVQDIYTGYSGLKRALENMNAVAPYDPAVSVDGKTVPQVEIGAILENGRATTIIINDRAPEKDGTTPVVPPVIPGESTLVGNNITVNLTDTAKSVGAVAGEVRNVLRAAGYTSIDTSNITTDDATGPDYAIAVGAEGDKERFDVIAVNWKWSIKDGNNAIAIVADGGSYTIAADKISGNGTGYINDKDNTYTAYGDSKALSSIGATVNITSGYVDITAMDTMTTDVTGVVAATGLTATTVTSAKTSPAAAVKYAKVGSNVTVTTTITAATNPAAAADITFTYTEGGTVKTCADTWAIADSAVAAGSNTHVFTISNVQGDITAANAVVKDHEDPHTVSVKIAGETVDNKTVNGIKVTLQDTSIAGVKKGDTKYLTVKIELTGSLGAKGVKLTTDKGVWVAQDVTGRGCTLASANAELTVPTTAFADDNSFTARIQYTTAVSVDEDVTLTVVTEH